MSSRVLIVEDEESMLHVLSMVLQEEGHETVGVASVAEARAYLAVNTVACVVLDYLLPDGTAEDVITWMVAREVTYPTVIISASRLAPKLAARYGISVVVKPDIDAIVGCVAASIRDEARPRLA